MAADLFLMLLSSFPSVPPFLSFSALLSPGPLRFAVAVCTWQTLQKAECATSDTKFRLLCGQCLAECNEYDQCLALLGDDDLQQILPDDSPGAQPHPRRHRYVHAQERERKRGEREREREGEREGTQPKHAGSCRRFQTGHSSDKSTWMRLYYARARHTHTQTRAGTRSTLSRP
jgi:hypothetical protein